MPNAINSRALTDKKAYILTMISHAVDAQKMNFQYTCTGATKIIPPSSRASPFLIIVQLYYNKLVVCYLCFMTSSILVRLCHHVVKQMSFEAILFVHIL